MLFFEEESGEFVNKEVKDETMWVVLVYNENEDLSSLEGQVPYIYDSVEELTKALKNQSKEFTGYVEEGNTLVIRKIECKTIRGV